MTRFILAILLMISGNFVNAQFWKTKISGNGNVISEQRQVGNFDKLSVTGPFEVKIVPGNDKLQIKADENLMNIIETYVKSGKLVIRINPDFTIRKFTELFVEVPTDYLSKIVLTGSGKIYNTSDFTWKNLKLTLTGSGEMDFLTNVPHLDVLLTGSGDIKLQGQADLLEATLTGSGELLAKNLDVTDANITLTGSGEAYIRCRDRLKIKIFGSGDVYYFGEPKYLKTKTFGSGDVIYKAL